MMFGTLESQNCHQDLSKGLKLAHNSTVLAAERERSCFRDTPRRACIFRLRSKSPQTMAVNRQDQVSAFLTSHREPLPPGFWFQVEADVFFRVS